MHSGRMRTACLCIVPGGREGGVVTWSHTGGGREGGVVTWCHPGGGREGGVVTWSHPGGEGGRCCNMVSSWEGGGRCL